MTAAGMVNEIGCGQTAGNKGLICNKMQNQAKRATMLYRSGTTKVRKHDKVAPRDVGINMVTEPIWGVV